MQTPKEFYSHNHEISREFELLKKGIFAQKIFGCFRRYQNLKKNT